MEELLLNNEGSQHEQKQMEELNQVIYKNNRFRRARTEEARNIRKTALLNAAKIIFFENGYKNTTIKDITDKAGVSIVFIYILTINSIFIKMFYTKVYFN
jgi:hypothetical protein